MEDYSKYSDPELATALRLGNDAAFKEIYTRYFKLLYLFAYNKLRDEEEAKDVVHDVFAWMIDHTENFALKTSLSSYLYKSVLNKIFNIFSHQAIIKKYIDQGDHYIEVDSTETDYLIREKDIAGMIRQEIEAMPPKMREVYRLRFEQYLSAKEIAAKLDISENTVNTHLKRAVKQLKNNLGIAVFVLYVLNG
ncbi:RNA polymerase sigma-70 factor (family 1) [Pedobacter africanus]|uniref:RNA polymerase sigma-70 factor (ECF subfamily) n=1 Tax=Pedobacter africanus TaxID=151894 RepID=A0ACC6L1B8_9SPHI|nr:RNA polymerase sigma-70 factor [Pedobacter africanus]MDR6785276.1 RNA polymerase sigma-70 factor (ECF subfamily) [Pedobacter africanus]